MLLEKLCAIKSNINFGDQTLEQTPTKFWVKDFILPMSIMPKIFIEDSGNLKHPKNVKSINRSNNS